MSWDDEVKIVVMPFNPPQWWVDNARRYWAQQEGKEEHMGPKDYPVEPMSYNQAASCRPDPQRDLSMLGCVAQRPQGAEPWTKQRIAHFGDCRLWVVVEESGQLRRANLDGSVHDQLELKALIGFLQELVR